MDQKRYHLITFKIISHQTPCPITLINIRKCSFVFVFNIPGKARTHSIGFYKINVAKTAGEDYESSLNLTVKFCVYSGKKAENS